MKAKPCLLASFIISLAAVFWGCSSGDSQRFTEQQSLNSFSSNALKVTMAGANNNLESNTSQFKCPTVSDMRAKKDITVFFTSANSNLPHFTMETDLGIDCEKADAIGVSVYDIPMTQFDIYQRCNASANEMYVTHCPTMYYGMPGEEAYHIVESCEGVDPSDKYACALIHEGDYQLVIDSEYLEDKDCYVAESYTRSTYLTSTPNMCWNCDAFEPMPLEAVFRGTQPSPMGCCSMEDAVHLDFCLKPCGCRKVTVKVIPKEGKAEGKALKLAVFSDVEGNEASFKTILEAAKAKGVDMLVNTGNLTGYGSSENFSNFYAIDKTNLRDIDGMDCTISNNNYCCDNSSESETRQFSNTCNAVLGRRPFITGQGGDDLYGNGLTTFQKTFGSSNYTTTIGKVQLIMLDTANGTFSDVQRHWLEGILDFPEPQTCNIPAPSSGTLWPTLAECLNSQNTYKTCSDCIGEEALCVPPDSMRSNPLMGALNCICIPKTANYCHNNQRCSKEDGTDGVCQCTRDDDCGVGGSCNSDGTCQPPVRLVFSYKPFFDNSGARGNAFSSRQEAASLLSMLQKASVSHIFSGSVTDYATFDKGNVHLVITGGAGAEMEAFSDYQNHWLLVTIPNAWTSPNPDDITIEIQNIEPSSE